MHKVISALLLFPIPIFFVQGSNFVDINNDGRVDIFSCSDLSDSRKYVNDGAGNFSYDNSLITTTSPPSDNSGNYASLWTDYDNDGDLDMYLSKCRQGVSDDTDLRRINKLLQNDGNHVFTDVAASAGLRIGAQTWMSDFADVDNDGDMDVFVLNHGVASQLFLNNGDGTFTDQTAASGFLPTLSSVNADYGIQAIFRDFNNDGYVDLLYSGQAHYLFYNDGDGTFTLASNPFGSTTIHSFAVGDLNQDGFLDIYAGHGNGYNNRGTVADDLFLNQGNSYHFLTVRLEGTQSNINGIGARVELYGAWGKQIREVRSGEGYGIMNSLFPHFGLGAETSIDSLIIRWPSGAVDRRYQVQVDQFYTLVEENPLRAQILADRTEAYPAPALIAFDGSSSSNPVGAALTYAWEFDDGNASTDEKPTHTFAEVGSFWVKLTVTDQNSDSHTDSLLIRVGDDVDQFPELDTDKDNDGIPDAVELAPPVAADLDGDGIENHLDLDADNDGIWDIIEAGGSDVDENAIIDVLANQGTFANPLDSDADGIPDFLDLESDNDQNDGTGSWDIHSSEFAYFDSNGDGQITAADTGGGTDIDQDGLDDLLDGDTRKKGTAPIGEEIFVSGHSVARKWNEVLLAAIRKDYARPTVHARNLHHISAAMYDAWSVYEAGSLLYFLGNTLDGFSIAFEGGPAVVDTLAAQKEAMSYAAYRLITHRFSNSPGKNRTFYLAHRLMEELGYDTNQTGVDYEQGGPAALGNYIAQEVIVYGLQDNSNEANDYANLFYEPVNAFIEIEDPGIPNLQDPNRWQPIAFDVFIDQAGHVVSGNVPDFLSPEWGDVSPFSLKSRDELIYNRDGDAYHVFHDPGAPPKLDTLAVGGDSELYKEAFSMVSTWSAHLDPTDGVMWDISPASIGNLPFEDLPDDFADFGSFYTYLEGGAPGEGRSLNPKTNAPYAPQMVPRGDYTRVLAEFWADGPDSETPPGHWFTILNYVADHPDIIKKWKGEGETLSDLEWDIKSYFTLGGTMHDAAISAWSVKGWHDYIRPISAIRYMAKRGQSSAPGSPNYDPGGIPLVNGRIELIESGDPLAGLNHEHVGKIKVYAWKGHAYITDPATDEAGVGWIRAEEWMPYQRASFVTPPFAGYVSGHSTFSRAAAEVMTFMTGDEYFPGGMGEFYCKKDEFLVFEDGPSQDLTLQWATYRDASDECSLSRIWGGIHPGLDDIPGRIMGKAIGEDAFAFSDSIFQGEKTLSLQAKAFLEGSYYEPLGLMDDFYRTDGLLQQEDPYGLGASLNPALLSATGGNALVDWIKLQLRDSDDPSIVLREIPLLIQRDGDLIQPDGNTEIQIENMAATSYFVALKHYIHLGVMTATAWDLTTNPRIDFTQASTAVYSLGAASQRDLNGTQLMWSGDANGDGNINALDLNLFWRPQNGRPFTYGNSEADFGMDGVINAVDLNFYWRSNNSKVEQVP